jgi:hypothetical protein
MALITAQRLANVLTPVYSAPTVSDTFRWEEGLVYIARVGVTSTTVTLLVPGADPFTGVAEGDVIASAVTSADRVFLCPKVVRDPATGLVTVTYSQVAGVTAALVKTPYHD